MFKDKVSFFATAALILALAFPTASLAKNPSAGNGQGQAAEKNEGKEAHPEIRDAMRHLEAAKNILEHKAAHDFGGHRVEAIKSIDAAMDHLRQALNYDKK
jgi:hypothetical protein